MLINNNTLAYSCTVHITAVFMSPGFCIRLISVLRVLLSFPSPLPCSQVADWLSLCSCTHVTTTMSRAHQPPLVTGISPNEGTSWTKVTIRGENLGTGPADLVGTTHTYTWKHKLAQTLSVSIKLYMFPPLSNYLLMRHNQQIRYMRRGWVRIGENLWRSIQFIEEGRGWGEKWDQG